MVMHSRSRPSFLPVPLAQIDRKQAKLAVTSLGVALVTAATVVALIVRFL
jgi:hypothetical protein